MYDHLTNDQATYDEVIGHSTTLGEGAIASTKYPDIILPQQL